MPARTYPSTLSRSFYGRHIFRGLMISELLRLLTYSIEPEQWKHEGIILYHHLRALGYARWHLAAVFSEVTWTRRAKILNRTAKKTGDEFFKTYRACVLTVPLQPTEVAAASRKTGPSTDGADQVHHGDIFPPKVFLAQSNAPRLGSILKR